MQDSLLAGDRRWFALLAVFMVQTFGAAASLSIPPLAPFIQDSFALTRAQIGLMVSALFLGSTLMSIPAGGFTDRIGVRRMLCVSQVLLGVLLASAALSRSFPEMFTLLLLAGIAYSGIAPATSKGVLEWFETRRRATAMGVKQSGVTIGALGSAGTLPLLALTFGWRMGLTVVGLAAAATGLVALLLYRDYFLPREGPVPQKRNRASLIQATLKNRNLLLFSLLSIVFASTQFSLLTYIVLYFTEVFAFGVVFAGLLLALATGAGTVGRILFGHLSDTLFRGGRKRAMVLVGCFTTGLTALFSLISPGIEIWVIVLITGAVGLVAMGHNAVMITFASESTPKEHAGAAVGVLLSILGVGIVIGPPLFGLAVDLTHSYPLAWRLTALSMAAATILLAVFVKETSRVQVTQ